jgi:hypothetical protein
MNKIFLIAIAGLAVISLAYLLGADWSFNKLPQDKDFVIEREPQEKLPVEEVAKNFEKELIGLWQSDNDLNYSREFKANKTAIDTYRDEEGSEQRTLSWNIFSAENPDEEYSGSYESNTIYLSLSSGRNIAFYKVNRLSSGKLTLSNLETGELQTFSKAR